MPAVRAWHRVPLVCDECGKIFYRLASQAIKDAANGNRHVFCSHRCHGAWLGKHFGFRLRAINHGWVRQVYLLSGWTSRQVASYLGLNYQTVTGILYKR